MSSRIKNKPCWTGRRNLDELLNDPVMEELYGLFLKVKDSPRHIAINAERVLNEVYYICSRFYQDKKPEVRLDEYAMEVEADMGWHYAPELIMSMAYAMMNAQRSIPKKIRNLILSLELKFGNNCYWDTFSKQKAIKPARHKAKTINLNLKELMEHWGGANVTPVIQVQRAEILVNSPGNIIGNNVEYGKR